MGKKEEVFQALEKGLKKETIMKRFDISDKSYYNYNSLWRKSKNETSITKANAAPKEPVVDEIPLDYAECSLGKPISERLIIYKNKNGEIISSKFVSYYMLGRELIIESKEFPYAIVEEVI